MIRRKHWTIYWNRIPIYSTKINHVFNEIIMNVSID
ncbi:hypothetical protein BLA29_011467 [Euroglyphus maynei]|uniref:Uncharacterized protein n=1 Tax=Euroglyphus maynei TaxID=6958 RepID=A0A1Y3B7J4_EURMA|nr:hypothetical protein BLA29_011467 [Euroglyphus maynei]